MLLFFKKHILPSLCILASLYVLGYVFFAYGIENTYGGDFNIYLQSVYMVLHHRDLYAPLFDIQTGFNYPPTVIPFFFPFAFTPVWLATRLWNILSISSGIAAVYLCFSLLKIKLHFSFFLLFLCGCVLLPAFEQTLILGQINLFVLFFLILSFYFSTYQKKSRWILSGIFLGVAISLKLFPILLILYFLFKKQYLTVLVSVGTVVLFFIAGTLGNWSYGVRFIRYSMQMSHVSHVSAYDLSLPSFFLQYVTKNTFVAFGLSVGIFCIVLLMLGIIRKKNTRYINKPFADYGLFSSLLAAIILLVTPLGWDHHMIFVLPFSLLLLAQFLITKKKYFLILFLLSSLFLYSDTSDIFTIMLAYFPSISTSYFNAHALLGLFIAFVGCGIYYLSNPLSRKA